MNNKQATQTQPIFQAFTYADPCVEYGPTLAYAEKAYTVARKAIREFVTATSQTAIAPIPLPFNTYGFSTCNTPFYK
ncbi:MAG: hypothetical protein ACXWL9_11080 [Syntrophales bacterium]